MNIENITSEKEKELPIRVLEVGAGPNSVLRHMVMEGTLSADQVVVSTPTADQLFADRFRENPEGVAEVAAMVFELPFADKSFSHVLASNMFGDPSFKVKDGNSFLSVGYADPAPLLVEPVFSELSRVLREDGEVCIIETYTPEVASDFLKKYHSVVTKYFDVEEGSGLVSKVPMNVGGGFIPDAKILTLKKKSVS